MFDAREKITHEKYLESFDSELQMKKDCNRWVESYTDDSNSAVRYHDTNFSSPGSSR